MAETTTRTGDEQVVCDSGHTRGELRKAFDRVSPANWKDRIDATIEEDDAVELDKVRQAVIFFTGSVPTISRAFPAARDNGRIWMRVRAAGYYATCGA